MTLQLPRGPHSMSTVLWGPSHACLSTLHLWWFSRYDIKS